MRRVAALLALMMSVYSFHTVPSGGKTRLVASSLAASDSGNSTSAKTPEARMSSFLDRQFFDPTKEDQGPLQWFADLTLDDYETAEALYAAAFISLLVIFTQELLRMQLYGNDYIPFKRL